MIMLLSLYILEYESFPCLLIFIYRKGNFWYQSSIGFPRCFGKGPDCQCRRPKRLGSDLWLERSPGGGDGNPLQYSCLENPMDSGAWPATVHRVTKSRTWLKWLSTVQSNIGGWTKERHERVSTFICDQQLSLRSHTDLFNRNYN